LERLLARGLDATAAAWPAIDTTYTYVHQAAHLLANHEGRSAEAVRHDYQELVDAMTQPDDLLLPLAGALAHFEKVTRRYWPGLFHCYDVADLPRTNNDLEQYFGSARYHERRATGRRGASPGLVVRGPVRLLAAVATQGRRFTAADLRPTQQDAWQRLRERLSVRQEMRRQQGRFRKDPAAYLAALEAQLLKPPLLS